MPAPQQPWQQQQPQQPPQHLQQAASTWSPTPSAAFSPLLLGTTSPSPTAPHLTPTLTSSHLTPTLTPAQLVQRAPPTNSVLPHVHAMPPASPTSTSAFVSTGSRGGASESIAAATGIASWMAPGTATGVGAGVATGASQWVSARVAAGTPTVGAAGVMTGSAMPPQRATAASTGHGLPCSGSLPNTTSLLRVGPGPATRALAIPSRPAPSPTLVTSPEIEPFQEVSALCSSWHFRS